MEPDRTLPGTPPLFVPFRRPGPLLPGRLLDRPNRFLGIVQLAGGQQIEAHIGDRGRLVDILFPGAEVYVVAAPPAGRTVRRTSFSLVCARCPPLAGKGPGPLCCLDPAFANRLVGAALAARLVPGLPDYGAVRPEVRVGASRFDFALTLVPSQERLLLEVKNAAAAAGGAALFPDAPSERATRHASELLALCQKGGQAAIVIVSQRSDVAEIRPHPVDPRFARALYEAASGGVRLIGLSFEIRLDGFHYAGPRPVVPHLLP